MRRMRCLKVNYSVKEKLIKNLAVSPVLKTIVTNRNIKYWRW